MDESAAAAVAILYTRIIAKEFFMKRYFKVLGIVALFVTIGFLAVSCGDNSGNYSLDGVYSHRSSRFQFKGSEAVLVKAASDWLEAQKRGNIGINDPVFRNITQLGSKENKQWSAETRLLLGTYQLGEWAKCTITLQDSGNLRVFCERDSTQTRIYTRVRE